MSKEKYSREPKSALAARRSFLKAVGASATAYPFYKLLENSHAQAVAGTGPLRFVGIMNYHGTEPTMWARRPGEPVGPGALDIPIGVINEKDSPLRCFDDAANYGYSFKQQINIFEGVDYGCGHTAVHPDGNGGHSAIGFFLTGSAPKEGTELPRSNHVLLNASLDQYLAGLYGGSENGTAFRSIETGTGISPPTCNDSIAVAPGDPPQFLSKMTSAAKLFDTVFANVMPMGADPAAQHRKDVNKSIFDFAIADIKRLQSRLAPSEKQKLDGHLTALRDIEARLTLDVSLAQGCVPPPRSALTSPPLLSPTAGGDRSTNIFMELLAEALACDLTRFATFVPQVDPCGFGPLIPELGGPQGAPADPNQFVKSAVGTDIDADSPIPQGFHNDISHKSGWEGRSQKCIAANAAQNRWYNAKAARLMRRLQDRGILDDTLILIGSEGSAGGHISTNIAIVLAGGRNAIRSSRRITHPARTPQVGNVPFAKNGTTPGWPGYPSGAKLGDPGRPPTSHNPILVAVANAFHKAYGHPERAIERYGKIPQNPDLEKGIAGWL